MIDKHWLWCGSCRCGYQSRWYFAEWLARIVARIHASLHGHSWGDLTIAAKGRSHNNLHCFDNQTTTVVAASLEEAREKWDEWTCFDPEDFDAEDIEDEHDIRQIPDDREIRIFVEDELEHKPLGLIVIGTAWKATASAWAQSQGKGFLCTTEY